MHALFKSRRFYSLDIFNNRYPVFPSIGADNLFATKAKAFQLLLVLNLFPTKTDF
jgi:hypothetical protein